ncbi:MAG: dTMP kinase [Synergistaceae bacterium]|jgi:dTMP kinase|nr:dTMP kinase [Synergistaceae bacterium]
MFIVLEGIDGCGKSTQSSRLGEWLSGLLGLDAVLVTYEPGGWPGGEAVRALARGGDFSSVWSEFFLFMMDRCEHVARVINPAIAGKKVVLCDRYMPSTLAYQVLSSTIMTESAAEKIIGLSKLIGLPQPDCTFFLDVNVSVAKSRMDARGKRDSFDKRGEDFFERVRLGYERLMRSGAGTEWVRLDAALDEESVFAALRGHVERLMSLEGTEMPDK